MSLLSASATRAGTPARPSTQRPSSSGTIEQSDALINADVLKGRYVDAFYLSAYDIFAIGRRLSFKTVIAYSLLRYAATNTMMAILERAIFRRYDIFQPELVAISGSHHWSARPPSADDMMVP